MNQIATSSPSVLGASRVPLSIGVSGPAVRWAIGVGAAAGVVYALSPLTVIVGLAMFPLAWWAARDLPSFERRAVLAMLTTAIVLRFAAVTWLFLTADPNAGSFAKFFGDEEFHQLRGLWLYNVWMGIPISTEAFLYAYNEIGYSGYQTFLVFVQLLVGPAPYGTHLLNGLLFLSSAVMLYRLARRSYGPAPALTGLAVMLFLPSLFSWSVSALKESLFVGLTAMVVVAVLQVVRARRAAVKVLAIAVALIGLRVIESVRPGGLMLTAGGLALGGLVRLVTLRRWARIGLTVVALLAVLSVARSGLPDGIDATLARFARYHRGHVFSSGHSYRLLDQVFYSDFFTTHGRPDGGVAMRPGELARYIIRAGANYVSQPVPWGIASRSELLFMPEQLVWYALAALFPIGVVFAFRRDALVTCLLAGYSVTNAAVLALNSGNIGTLVRHRALAVPFLVWISATGFVGIVSRKGGH